MTDRAAGGRTTTTRTGRLARATAALAVLALGACGLGTDDEPRAIDADSAPGSLGDATVDTTEQSGASQSIDAYFVHTVDGESRLAPLDRRVSRVTPGSVLEALFTQPPTDAERFAGYSTAISSSASLATRPQLRSDGVLVVDLSKSLYEVQGDTLRNAYGQMVCTLTALDEVAAVTFQNEGEPINAPDVENRETRRPLRCRDYAELLEEGG